MAEFGAADRDNWGKTREFQAENGERKADTNSIYSIAQSSGAGKRGFFGRQTLPPKKYRRRFALHRFERGVLPPGMAPGALIRGYEFERQIYGGSRRKTALFSATGGVSVPKVDR